MVTPTCMYGSPLPYMEEVLYGPPHVCLVPPYVKCLHVIYYSYGLSHTLNGKGIILSPTCTYGPLHMYYCARAQSLVHS